MQSYKLPTVSLKNTDMSLTEEEESSYKEDQG